MADLAALSGRSAAYADEQGKMQDVSVAMQYGEWQPPKGQRGDGKTSLNDKLGY